MLSIARKAASSSEDPTIDLKPLPHAPPVLHHKQHLFMSMHGEEPGLQSTGAQIIPAGNTYRNLRSTHRTLADGFCNI